MAGVHVEERAALGATTGMPPRGRTRGWTLVAAAVALSVVAGGISGGATAALIYRAGATPVATASPSPSAQRTSMPVPDVPAMIAALQVSVVSIDVITVAVVNGRTQSFESSGTGFVIRADGLIATNAHVVDGARQITVALNDGSKLRAVLRGIDPANDLAVIAIARTGLTPVSLGSSATLRVGEIVVAVGNALALEGGLTASMGIVSALDRTVTTSNGHTYTHLVQTDAAINAGDSGGPLMDANGKVVGINTAGASTAENIGFAIAIDEAEPILQRLAA